MGSRLEESLRRVALFKGASATTLAAAIAAGLPRTSRAGEILFCEGDPSPGLYVVIDGRVKTYKIDRSGRELTLGIAERGDIVGSPATFDGGNCPYHAIAFGDSQTVLFHVTPERFAGLLVDHPSIAAGAVRFVAIENRRLIEMLKAQTLHGVKARFAAYLLHAAGESATFRLPETNAGIAAHLGTVREVVSRTLHQFEDEGYIALRGRVVRVTDPDRLREAAGA